MSILKCLSSAIVILLFHNCIAVSFAAPPTTTPAGPEINHLIQRAKETRKRLETNSAKWRFTLDVTGNTTTVAVDWMTSPAGSSVDFSLISAGRPTVIAQMIDRDGFWFASEGGRSEKYLPFEVPFRRPSIPFYYEISRLRSVDQLHAGFEFVDRADAIATYRAPLWEPLRGQIQTTLDEQLKSISDFPGRPVTPRLKLAMSISRDMLDHGVTVKVDTRTGLLTEEYLEGRLEKWTPLVWLPVADDAAINISNHPWADHSSAPGADDPTDLVMMAHNGMVLPGVVLSDGDARIVNVKTGQVWQVWRVPFTGGRCSPGCFLKDRNVVVVYSPNIVGYGGGLYTVNLKTRENHRLGGSELTTGYCVQPAASNDGHTLAFLYRGSNQSFNQQQIILLDLDHGTTRPLGAPCDAAYLSWLPDDSRLILMQRHPFPFEDQPDRTIISMTLDGQFTKVISDDAPLALNSHRILFRERALDPIEWQSCLPDGSDVQTLGDGLTDFTEAAGSPDGQRLLMLRRGTDVKKPSMPFILDRDGKNPRPLAVHGGFWSEPRW